MFLLAIAIVLWSWWATPWVKEAGNKRHSIYITMARLYPSGAAEMFDSASQRWEIDRQEFIRLDSQFANRAEFFDSNNQPLYVETHFDFARENTLEPLTDEVPYELYHPVNSLQSNFNTDGLYERPQLIDGRHECQILGGEVTAEERLAMERLNAWVGQTRGVRVYICRFYSAESEIASRQRMYWGASRPGEILICIGYQDERITWCRIYSNSFTEFDGHISNWIMHHSDGLYLPLFAELLDHEIEHEWEPRHFALSSTTPPDFFQRLLASPIPIHVWGGFCMSLMMTCGLMYLWTNNRFKRPKRR